MKQELSLVLASTTTTSETSSMRETKSIWTPTQAYHEMAEVPVREIDLIESVEANLAQLEEMQLRLRFMVREVKYLLKA